MKDKITFINLKIKMMEYVFVQIYQLEELIYQILNYLFNLIHPVMLLNLYIEVVVVLGLIILELMYYL